MKRVIETSEAPAAVGPYSQGIVVGNLLFTSGQVALTPSGELVSGSIEEETHQVMTNLGAILGAAAVDFSKVVKTTIYLTDVSTYPQVNAAYAEHFADGQYPARECVGVLELPLGARVEISMIADVSA